MRYLSANGHLNKPLTVLLTQVPKILNGGVINLEIGWHEERALAHEGIQKNHLESDDSLIQRRPMKIEVVEKIVSDYEENRKKRLGHSGPKRIKYRKIV